MSKKRWHRVAVRGGGWDERETLWETALFAVGRHRDTLEFIVTHKPTGFRVPGYAASLKTAIKLASALSEERRFAKVRRRGDSVIGIPKDLRRRGGELVDSVDAWRR